MSTHPLKGLVLAGGKGTRLRPLTFTTAKQLVPVANQPILLYVLDSLVQGGVSDIGIIISPETGDAVRAVVNQWCPSGISITYIVQDQPAGLAHAVLTAQPFLEDNPFIMVLGDNLVQSALSPLIEAFCSDTADAYILLKQVPNPTAFGVAELNAEEQVIGLEEKPLQPKSNLALVGVYLFTPQIFKAIAQIKPSARGELEITDAIQKLIDLNCLVKPYRLEGWWLDTGKKDDLLEANRLVLDTFCKTRLHGTLDDVSEIRGRVEIGEGSQISHSVIQGPVRIGRNCRIEHAYIGPYTSVGNGSQISHAEVENCVFLENCRLVDLSVRIEQSLIGQGCFITRVQGHPATYRFLLGDQSMVEIL